MSGVEGSPRPAMRPRIHRGMTVPYITAWSGEDILADPGALPVLRTGPGRAPALVYPDEQSQDRDRYGILWRRVTWAPGEGQPRFARVHPTRHRRVMLRGLCQTCTAPASLWMTPAPAWQAHLERLGPDAPYLTMDPPVCRSCAATVAAQCPNLRAVGHFFLAPRRWANVAVRGQIAEPDTDSFSEPRLIPLPGAVTTGAPVNLRLVMAESLISGLFEVTAHREADRIPGLGQRLDSPAHTCR